MPDRVERTSKQKVPPKRPVNRSRIPKFDKWLQNQADKKEKVNLHFAVPPLDGTAVLQDDVQILQVDKFMILVEFSDGEAYWIAKGIITAAGMTAE